MAGQRVRAEFGHDDGLVRAAVLKQLRQELEVRRVPSHVFVDADDVEVLREAVTDRHLLAAHEAGRGDHPRVVLRVRAGRKRAHEGESLVGVRVFVAHGPDDHARAVVVTSDQLAQLVLRVLIRRFPREADRPVHRDLFPQKEPFPVRELRHLLIVRVVREAHEIAAELLRDADRLEALLVARCLAVLHALLVAADAAQEDRLSVQQNIVALHPDLPESDLVADGVVTATEHRLIQIRPLRRPEFDRHLEDGLSFAAMNRDLYLRLVFRSCFPGSLPENSQPAQLKLRRHIYRLREPDLHSHF